MILELVNRVLHTLHLWFVQLGRGHCRRGNHDVRSVTTHRGGGWIGRCDRCGNAITYAYGEWPR